MRALLLVPFMLSLAAAACTPVKEGTAPSLEVLAPERGASSGTGEVTVTGQVDDAGGAVRVTVNGVAAAVDADGQFTATVRVRPGIEVIETLAVDDAGNQQRDVRAVLSGDLLPTGGAVRDAVGAHLGPVAFSVLGDVLGDTVSAMDLTAAVRPMNPVFLDDGCLGARVDVTGVRTSGVQVRLVPGAGAIGTQITVSDLRVDLHADYDVACVGGSSDLVVRASAVRLGGRLGLDVIDGDLTSALRDVDVRLEGFDLEAGGLPGAVLDLIDGVIDDALADALEQVLTDAVPGLVDDTLAELTASTYTLPVLGRSVGVQVTPTDVDLEAGGVSIAVDAAMRVTGGEGAMYLSTASPLAAAQHEDGDGVAVAVNDDALNQLFAGMWKSGALGHQLALAPADPLTLLLGSETTTLEVSMSLPPTVSADGSGDLRLVIGDLIVRGRDQAGDELSTIAVSMSTTVGASAGDGGRIRLRLGEAEVWGQILWQSDRLERPMAAAQVEELVRAVWGLVEPMTRDALDAMPIPALGGVALTAPSLQARGGYLVLRTGLTAAP